MYQAANFREGENAVKKACSSFGSVKCVVKALETGALV
jgi:hypothetical protein